MKSLTRMAGLFLLLIGLGAAVYFFMFFDVSVETNSGDRVVNLSLMSQRQNGIVFGFGMAVVGAIIVAIGNMGAKAADRVPAPPQPVRRAAKPGEGPTWKSAKEIESDIDWDKM
ncbi:MAG: hypothetical protein K8T20_19605 [Planctomycetes bacterium]|nr:hypothetical protein [Planctomycetota bacterium]